MTSRAELGQRQPGVGRVGAERMEGLQALGFVVRAARGLAVDRDQVVPAGPECLDPVLETAPEQDRIDPVDQSAQPPLTGNAEMKHRRKNSRWCRPHAAISSKSSHDAMVAQVRSSSTSDSGYITRQDSRSSSRREKCSRSRASRARGSASSANGSVVSSMLAPSHLGAHLESQQLGQGKSLLTSIPFSSIFHNVLRLDVLAEGGC